MMVSMILGDLKGKSAIIVFGLDPDLPDVMVNLAGVMIEGYFENQSLDVFPELMDT